MKDGIIPLLLVFILETIHHLVLTGSSVALSARSGTLTDINGSTDDASR